MIDWQSELTIQDYKSEISKIEDSKFFNFLYKKKYIVKKRLIFADLLNFYFKIFKKRLQKLGIEHYLSDFEVRKIIKQIFCAKVQNQLNSNNFYELINQSKLDNPYFLLHSASVQIYPKQFINNSPKKFNIMGHNFFLVKKQDNPFTKTGKFLTNDTILRQRLAKLLVQDFVSYVKQNSHHKKVAIYLIGDGPALLTKEIIVTLVRDYPHLLKKLLIIIREISSAQIKQGKHYLSQISKEYQFDINSTVVWLTGSAVGDSLVKIKKEFHQQSKNKLNTTFPIISSASAFVLGALKNSQAVQDLMDLQRKIVIKNGHIRFVDFCQFNKKTDKRPFLLKQQLDKGLANCYQLWQHQVDNLKPILAQFDVLYLQSTFLLYLCLLVTYAF